ncbi:MAG: molybdopterin-dependent oxidoreductase [Ardenticatenaceae bacterium]|nr:molybdopterin-dependent oxidoreductase [Ardenticatenaceae bacterium]MCB8946736.1 molybdopterin-dependent oxidoreductase [Ardenticatenaceae bacterium]
MKNTNEKDITRRGFLQGSLALAGAAAFGTHLMPASRKTLIPGFALSEAARAEWVKSYCSSCIWPNCGTEVNVVDGVALRLRGNKEHPFNKGTLCPRGNALLMSLYNPYRVKAPMKRTNPEKGKDIDPGWVEISWEEAYSTVAERLKKLQETDPRQLLMGIGFASNLHEAPLVMATAALLGSPNTVFSAGPLCDVHYGPYVFNQSMVDRIDFEHCNFLIEFGRNTGGSVMFGSGGSRALANALARGMELIVIDPHVSPEASKGEWVPIKPATDLAFGMAMLHLILHEIQKYDVEALKTRTNMPYLIDAEGEYVRDAETNKPLLWDMDDGVAKTHDDPSLGDVALEGTYTVNGVEAVPAFVLLKQSVVDTTPEWAEELTGIKAAKIRDITERFIEEARIGATIVIDGVELPYRPAALAVGRGSANQMQGKDFYVVADTINMMMGGMGVPGSMLCAPPPTFEVIDGVATSHRLVVREVDFKIPQNDYNMSQFYPAAHVPPLGSTWAAIVDPEKYYLDYEIDTFIYYGFNALVADTNPELVEAALSKIPFTVGIAYNFDEPSYWADILLPENSNYERYQARMIGEDMAVDKEKMHLHGIHAKTPVLDKPLYDTAQFEDMLIELADRVGLLPALNGMFSGMVGLSPENALNPTTKYAYKDMVDAYLRSFTGDNDKGLEYFIEHGFYIHELPVEDCYEYCRLKERNARIGVYNYSAMQTGKMVRRNLEEFNVNIPGWDDPEAPLREYKAIVEWRDNWQVSPPTEFDMYAVNWKQSVRNMGNGAQDDNVFLREIVENWDFDDLYIQINSATAREKGLKTGDRILVESVFGGTVEGVIKTTGLIGQNILGFPGQAGHWSKHMNPRTRQGTNYNPLLSMKENDLMLTGSIVISPPVKVSKI